jgi:hypothetical protein
MLRAEFVLSCVILKIGLVWKWGLWIVYAISSMFLVVMLLSQTDAVVLYLGQNRFTVVRNLEWWSISLLAQYPESSSFLFPEA